jgi:hypothetical protein
LSLTPHGAHLVTRQEMRLIKPDCPPQGVAPRGASEGGTHGSAEMKQLLDAARKGDVKAGQALMLTAQPPPVDARDGKQCTPLMKAAKRVISRW